MRSASVAAAGFAFADGVAVDPAGVVHVAHGPDRFGRMLLVCVEPLNLTARGTELAEVALRVIRETFAATPGAAADALLAAFSAANAAVIAENRPLATGRWVRRICVGATAIALAGREIVVAQAAPSQAILVQDNQVYCFPDIDSWRGNFVPNGPTLVSNPLGFAEGETPRLFQSESAPGDLIALCATSVGRVLAKDEDAAVSLYNGSLLTEDLEGSIDHLERLLARYETANAFAVVASVNRLPRQSWRRPAMRPTRGTDNPIAAVEDRRRLRGALFSRKATMTGKAATGAPDDGDDRLPLFEGVRDAAIKTAEFLLLRKRPLAPDFATRRRVMAAPGALSVSRYRESSGMPAEWRANLPRGPGVHVPARLLAVSVVLFATIGGTGFAVGQQKDRDARVSASLASVDAALRNALDNPVSAVSLVAEAEAAVEGARNFGATGASLTERERNLATVRDQVWKIDRFVEVKRIGALPNDAASGPVRLALAGKTLYLAAGNLYELDVEGERLISLLAAGDTVTGGAAGVLRDVSIDDGHVVVSDGEATYLRDKAGTWQRRALAVADVGGLRNDMPVITWGDATYGLSREGNIVRFDETSGGPMADIWAAAEASPDLEIARDLVIDGRIHVLLHDGRTLTFSRGELVGTVSPFVMPTLSNAAFLAQAPFATDFYIADTGGKVGSNVGRVIRVDAAGEVRQYLTPAASPGDTGSSAAAMSLSTLQDMAIDELTGVVYWVSDNEIWRASLPRD